MVDINPNISKMTVSVNGLYTSIKSQRLPEWIKKQHPTICYLQATHFRHKDTDRLKIKRKIYHGNTTKKKAGVAILISDKADFRTRKVIMDKKNIK